jgi:transposase
VRGRISGNLLYIDAKWPSTMKIVSIIGALEGFTIHQETLSDVEHVLVDGGYTGAPFATAVDDILGATVEVAKHNTFHTFKVIPKRWVVERSFA